MKHIFSIYKRFYLILLLGFTACLQKANAQSLSFSVSPGTQCYNQAASNSATALVTGTLISATNYQWVINGPCSSPGFTNAASNGSIININYPCCGTYTFYCTAYNGTTSLALSTGTTVVACSPNVSAIGINSIICAGSSSTLFAAGAINYTWSTGQSGSQIVVSPTANANYTVIGSNFSGCQDSAVVNIFVLPPLQPNFNYSVNANGLVNFTNTTVNSNSNTLYQWSFGNGSSSSSVSPSTTYSANGVYTVMLTANNGCGTVSITHTVVVFNVGPSCAASFSSTPGLGGDYTFTSTSTGTGSNTVYIWNFGNGSPSYSATGSAGINPPAQTYSTGIYTVTLQIVTSNPFCSSTATLVIQVCNLQAAFYITQIASTTYSFINTSTGTTATTTYSWNYGDGHTGTVSSPVHTYTASGNYVVVFMFSNGPCFSSVVYTLSVHSCSLVSNFTHTILTNGVVTFSNTSLNPASSYINYKWDFGDGVYSFLSSPTHTYLYAGTYDITLKMRDSSNFCNDSLTQSINVTGISCLANSNFTIIPTNIPQYWNAIPAYPWNITAANWSWGDGSSSDSLYTSHVYGGAGNYSICLSVTVSCGASSSYCFPYFLNRSDAVNSQVVHINILPPEKTNGLVQLNSDNFSFNIYPNPNNGEFTLKLENMIDKKIHVSLYSLIGELVYSSEEELENGNPLKTIFLKNINSGIYFVQINAGSKRLTEKIVITK